MTAFSIDVRTNTAAVDNAHSIAIRAGNIVFSKLLRPGLEHADEFLSAPPAALAFWLVDNWWRLRYECIPPKGPTDEWLLAHDMAAVGGGYVWPNLSIWGEGDRVAFASRSDPPGVVGPVRYITDALLYLSGAKYEAGAEKFIAFILQSKPAFASDREALKAQWAALSLERQDPEVCAWRRLEAELGFDSDSAPEELMLALASLAERYGKEGIEEAAQAAPGLNAEKVLRNEITAAQQSGWECDFTAAVSAAKDFNRDVSQPPWKAAEDSAQRVRMEMGVSIGQVSDNLLSELAGISEKALRPPIQQQSGLIYGLRLRNAQGSRNRVAFRNRAHTGRRFELCRAVGDAIWSKGDSLGPLARSKTARQKFQRAFAQSLLCPFDELMGMIDTSDPTDEDINTAAQYFGVAEMVVRTTLVNKNILERQGIEEFVEAA